MMASGPYQLIRIAALLVVIFAGGILTGRWSAPRQRILVTTSDGRTVSTVQALRLLTRMLQLDAQQQEQANRLLQESAEAYSRTVPGSSERLALFRAELPKLKALLRPDQLPAFDEYVAAVERHFRQAQQRRARP